MTTYLKEWTMDPFDIVWKNLFDANSNYNTIQHKINYPVDIYETDNGLRFELAVVGLAGYLHRLPAGTPWHHVPRVHWLRAEHDASAVARRQ